jgi:hypothetical protein
MSHSRGISAGSGQFGEVNRKKLASGRSKRLAGQMFNR